MKILYKKTNFKEVGFSTMAFTAKILSWPFRHLNIVACLLKRRPTKGGGSRALQDPPSYTPEVVILLKCRGLIFFYLHNSHFTISFSYRFQILNFIYVEILPCSFSAGECMKFYVSV